MFEAALYTAACTQHNSTTASPRLAGPPRLAHEAMRTLARCPGPSLVFRHPTCVSLPSSASGSR